MRKVLQRLDNVCFKTIKKAIAMLEKSPITYAEVVENKNKQQSVDYTMVHLSSSRSSYFYAFYFPTFSFWIKPYLVLMVLQGSIPQCYVNDCWKLDEEVSVFLVIESDKLDTF